MIKPTTTKPLEHEGSVFKRIRLSKGLTQKDIACYDTPADPYYICTEDTIRKFENSGNIGKDKLAKLLHRVGYTRREFYDVVEGVELEQFKSDFVTIKVLASKGDWDSIPPLLAALKVQPYTQLGYKQVAQSIGFMDGVLTYGKDKNYALALELFHDTLSLTVSGKLFDEKGQLVCNIISKHVRTAIEFHIVKAIAIVKYFLKQTNIAIDIYQAIIDCLTKSKVDPDIAKEIMPSTFLNLAIALFDLERWEDMLNTTETGITFCKKNQSFNALPGLHWNKGRAYFHLGDKVNAKKYFTSAYTLFLDFDLIEQALFIKKHALEHYNIILRNC